ncbi:inorganic triphosphatase [Rosenbergiella australiborealis]|uniref:Inorganic triphosphatase n=1 Tax=Rosenbergiella australiborealis TaxID=1544696 RepID=A0ABS5T848_9GAMM|nr:inorganic triphosphatase [Rosenbergiella australiborealis]MBT0727123.1 inorganic triphosphatase [Rosenbergiella australiborealis]
MTIEIEVKFLVDTNHIDSIKQQLNLYPNRYTPPVLLANHYYETADNQLRRWDMGLRIRGKNGQYEMTLKTAGQEIGGLHQRPEYNIPLTEHQLDLTLLPQEVWPADTDISALQAALSPLFSTDFRREKWVITYRESEIEVAFDQGHVGAGEQTIPLLELELELLNGKRSDLFALAAELINHGGIRLGWQSKAARGYGLAQGVGLPAIQPLMPFSVIPKASCEQGLSTLLSALIRRWQLLESHWLENEAQALPLLLQTLLAIRETFTLFGGLISRSASSEIRQRLTVIEEALQQKKPNAQSLCFSVDGVQAQLQLTELVVAQQWRQSANARQLKRLDGSFKRFCDVMLSRCAADLHALAAENLIANQAGMTLLRLDKLILSITLLSSAYPREQLEAWLAPWVLARQYFVSDQDAIRLPLPVRPLSPFWLTSNTAKDSLNG